MPRVNYRFKKVHGFCFPKATHEQKIGLTFVVFKFSLVILMYLERIAGVRGHGGGFGVKPQCLDGFQAGFEEKFLLGKKMGV